MRDKLLFVGASVLVSFVLFTVLWLANAAHIYTPWDVGFVLAAVAVMIAALGVPWRRKVVAVVLTLGGFSVFGLFTLITGSEAVAARGSVIGQMMALLGVVYALVPLVYPLAALAIFMGRDPSVLWTRRSALDAKRQAKRRAK
jgi:hypothetical protein